ncbi:sulfite exporter TauE/SafE family protein [Planctomycetota bacterium]
MNTPTSLKNSRSCSVRRLTPNFISYFMDYVILSIIGLAMGLSGGLLGIGGSIVMIPAMTLAFGENQHLYQAASMICNFFVALSSVVAHRRAGTINLRTLRIMVPVGMVGVVLGVAGSNLSFFANERSYLLARIFGIFLVYVAVLNAYKLIKTLHRNPDADITTPYLAVPTRGSTVAVGLITGLSAGLLGIGAGSVATPLQQVWCKTPLRRAMSNSAGMIVCITWLGALIKNATLGQHHIDLPVFSTYPAWAVSLLIAWTTVPTALIGGYLGGYLMHRLPKNLVRACFIVIVGLAATQFLTVS